MSMFIAPFLGRFLMSIMPEFTDTIYANSKIQLLYMTAFVMLVLLISLNYLIPAIIGKKHKYNLVLKDNLYFENFLSSIFENVPNVYDNLKLTPIIIEN